MPQTNAKNWPGFDATVPVTQASADVAATGSANAPPRRDHKHGMPALAPDVSAAKFITVQAEAALSAEVSLGALTTGLLKHTVAAGVSTPATATKGTDYALASSGSYAGDNSQNRAIAHGLGIAPKFVLIVEVLTNHWFRIFAGLASSISYFSTAELGLKTVTTPDATNFYVGGASLQALSANASGVTYYWVAIT